MMMMMAMAKRFHESSLDSSYADIVSSENARRVDFCKAVSKWANRIVPEREDLPLPDYLLEDLQEGPSEPGKPSQKRKGMGGMRGMGGMGGMHGLKEEDERERFISRSEEHTSDSSH